MIDSFHHGDGSGLPCRQGDRWQRSRLGGSLALPVMLLVLQWSSAIADSGLSFRSEPDRVVLIRADRPVGEYVFGDPQILRPYFANLRTKGELQVTRRFPPVKGKDAVDHSDMHPGVWIGFGDINGHDFWRNKGRIEHIRFTQGPEVVEGRVRFATESKLIGREREDLGRMENRLTVEERGRGWRLTWRATLSSPSRDLVLGDQEEMGFGARVATEITEKNGGTIVSSEGQTTAKGTWGRAAAWCDYSGTIEGTPCGVTLMTGPANFRTSWWHNRDYGLLVANAFGRSAMKQGDRSEVTVKQGESLELVYGATVHEGAEYDPAREHEAFVKSVSEGTR